MSLAYEKWLQMGNRTLGGKIINLKGPIIIVGGSGFIGANLLRRCLEFREDIVGTFFSSDSWRLRQIPESNIAYLNFLDPISCHSLFHRIMPRTVFDCSSFGGYAFERDIERIHSTNYISLVRMMEELAEQDLAAYIHAGSSSEYGMNASAPVETDLLSPNSHYAVSKAAAYQAISYYGKVRGIPVVNLRMYSVYGPYEDSSRLIPKICEGSLHGKLPIFGRPDATRDFVHIEDIIEAFVDAALQISPKIAGESFNIGTGIPTSLLSLAGLSKRLFNIPDEPQFNLKAARDWDVDDWHGNSLRAKKVLGWEAKISLEYGLTQTREWWKSFLAKKDFSVLTKNRQPREKKSSISAIVACYKDGKAIPEMHKRLVSVFKKNGLNFEIIFVDDGSPDSSTDIIRNISAEDPHVLGITHSRNFGSQAAFRSGMEIASKEACVLLDGDLQDPPEIIESFVQKWREGADVVYGRRVKREMPAFVEFFYRGFYRLFALMSEVPIPRDAGDFSLMDGSVVYWILQCQERDAFIRGLRAYVGFKQEGVDYVRPKRVYGPSTNNWIKNLGWAKKGIFSFSRTPLHMLTAVGGTAFVSTVILGLVSIAVRFVSPESVPKGLTYISLLVMFFGSISILGIGLLGEYIGKIFEETKARPAFIRRGLIVRGEMRPAKQEEPDYYP